MSLANFPSYLLTAVVFLAMISVLVAAHEYGHYVFARLFGMGVEEFAIGMGKKLKVWRRKTYEIPVGRDYVHDRETISRGAMFEGGDHPSESELIQTDRGAALRETTEFTVRMLPIGGFVRIKGMIPHDDGSEINTPGGFYNKPPWQRLVVLVAGPAASVLSGLLFLVLVFMIHGLYKPVPGEPILGAVFDSTPAARAGLREGDRILAINFQPISTFGELVDQIGANAKKPILVQYSRADSEGFATLVPELAHTPKIGPDLEPGTVPVWHGVIGIAPRTHLVRLDFTAATAQAVRAPVEAVAGLFRIAKQPSSFKDEAGGVTMMVRATHEATQEGVAQVITLACLLSISVGIFNLLPIPPLDGGQMAMAFAELLRGGRRLSVQVQQTLTSAGIFLVLVLFVVVMFIDFQRLSGKGDAPLTPVHSSSQPKK